MKGDEILACRMGVQFLIGKAAKTPVDVVERLCAVQAQDFYGAKWALGQRADCDDETVEKAFNQGKILRTHVMRPTWHFVLPKDIRFMLELTKKRVHVANQLMCRKIGLTAKTLSRTNNLLCKALEGKNALDRIELAEVLKKARIDVSESRLVHVLMHAELESLIISGPRKGKQFTYMLMDERVPEQKALSRDVALAQLAARYLDAHGPATLQDFAWWSGLTAADAKAGLEAVKKNYASFQLEGREYWHRNALKPQKLAKSTVRLLPNYDEYGIAYKLRDLFYKPEENAQARKVDSTFRHLLLIDGKVRGTWDRTLSTRSVRITTRPFGSLDKAVHSALHEQSERYARFLKLSLAP